MTPLDLRDQLTVFVVWSGEPDFEATIAALDPTVQGVRARLDVVDHVAPMDRAFQAMLDRCQTPYFVQVDADMVLHPGALAMMWWDLDRCCAPTVALVCYPLLDPHLGFLIFGCKCYRHEIVRRYPYVEGYSCEVSQLDRMAADGYTFLSRWPEPNVRFDDGYHQTDSALVVGLHSPTWTPERIWTRYRRLAQKYRRFGYTWMGALGRLLLDHARGGEGLDAAAFAGWLAGTIGPLASETEQDHRVQDEDCARVLEALWLTSW